MDLTQLVPDCLELLLAVYLDPPSLLAISCCSSSFRSIYKSLVEYRGRNLDACEPIESAFHFGMLCARLGYLDLYSWGLDYFRCEIAVEDLFHLGREAAYYGNLQFAKHFYNNKQLRERDVTQMGENKAFFSILPELLTLAPTGIAFFSLKLLAFAIIYDDQESMDLMTKLGRKNFVDFKRPLDTGNLADASCALGLFGSYHHVVKFRCILASSEFGLSRMDSFFAISCVDHFEIHILAGHIRSRRFDPELIRYCSDALLSAGSDTSFVFGRIVDFSRLDILEFLAQSYPEDDRFSMKAFANNFSNIVRLVAWGYQDFLVALLDRMKISDYSYSLQNFIETQIDPLIAKSTIVTAALLGPNMSRSGFFDLLTANVANIESSRSDLDSRLHFPLRFDESRVDLIEYLFPILGVTKENISIYLAILAAVRKEEYGLFGPCSNVSYLRYLKQRWGVGPSVYMDFLINEFNHLISTNDFTASASVLSFAFEHKKPSANHFRSLLFLLGDGLSVEGFFAPLLKSDPTLLNQQIIPSIIEEYYAMLDDNNLLFSKRVWRSDLGFVVNDFNGFTRKVKLFEDRCRREFLDRVIWLMKLTNFPRAKEYRCIMKVTHRGIFLRLFLLFLLSKASDAVLSRILSPAILGPLSKLGGYLLLALVIAVDLAFLIGAGVGLMMLWSSFSD